MGIADDLLKRFGYIALAESEKPETGRKATQGGSTVTQIFGNPGERVGSYNPEAIGQSTFAKMERHFQVRVGLSLIYLPLMTARWSVSGPDPAINEFINTAMKPLWRPIMRNVRTMVSRGCCPAEVVWEHKAIDLLDESEGIDTSVEAWVVTKVKDIDPPSLAAILLDGLEEFAGYEVNQPTGVKLDAAKCFHLVNEPRFGNLWGTSRLVGAYDPWYRQQLLWDFFMRYMERRGTPTTIVEFPPGKQPDGQDNSELAQTIAAGLTTDDAAAWVPSAQDGMPGWDIRLLEDGQRSQGFLDALNAHNAWILRAMMIPDKVFAQDDSVGSYSLAETHADMYLLGEDGLLFDVVDAINDQLVPRMVRFTYGPDAPVPRIETPGLSDSTRAYMGDLFKLLVQGGQVNLDTDAIGDALGIPVLEEEMDEEPEPAIESPDDPDDIEQPEDDEADPDEAEVEASFRSTIDDVRLLQRRARLLLAMRGD